MRTRSVPAKTSRSTTPWSLALTPYAAGQFTTYDLPSYAEQVL
ncbi:phage baseplate assembly protein gpV [Bradyrhizobium sp. USDA 4518]